MLDMPRGWDVTLSPIDACNCVAWAALAERVLLGLRVDSIDFDLNIPEFRWTCLV